VDIDPRTYNFSFDGFMSKLEVARQSGKLPKIIIPVHLAGQSPEMDKISKVCRDYDIKIIEDASHAIGATYQGSPVGKCIYSDITVFSFHPVKIITTGEGGACTTNDLGLANQMRLLRSHGITKDKSVMTNTQEGDWYYEQQALGFNYRMTDLQAALGVSQVKKLSGFIAKRHEIASRYDKALSGVAITPYHSSDCHSSYHLYIIRLKESNEQKHKRLFQFLRDQKIGVNLHYIPVYKHPFHKSSCDGPCPHAENYYRSAISLPMFPTLTSDEQDYVISQVKKGIAQL
jgi:dTDP-4-amino-4,6-dideoxygalactose transaminase